MTLERHRSRLIPEVAFAPGGRLFVTDGEGTFPLSGGKRREKIPDFKKDPNDNDVKPDSETGEQDVDVQSYRSYDPKRERRFRPREPSRYEREVKNISSTLSSGGSRSLQRKLRRWRTSQESPGADYDDDTPEFGSLNLVGTMSDRGRSRRRPATHPSAAATPYPGSLGRRKVKKRLSIGTLKRPSKSAPHEEVYTKSGSAYMANGSVLDDIPELVDVRNKKIAEEKLPGLFFLVCGVVMLVLALVKLLLSWWQSFYAPLWTSVMIICLGIAGILHRGDYLTTWRNALYICFGVLSLGTALACCGLLLREVGPQTVQLGSGIPPEAIVLMNNHTSSGRSLVGDMPVTNIVPLNIGLDMAILVLCLISLYSITATIVAISNHWDAVYMVTGDCDHRGTPRLFNPMEQAILGMVACLIGLIVIAFTQFAHVYGIPAIAGGMIIVAGFASFCYGKRPDAISLGILAFILETLALILCGAATVILTLALVEDLEFTDKDTASRNQAITSLTFTGVYFLMMVVNVIFASGLLFRVCRKACCACILEDPMMDESHF